MNVVYTLIQPRPSATLTPPTPLATGQPPRSLADLADGASATIDHLTAEHHVRLRMQALGLMPGRRVQVIRKAPFNGPLQVRSGHTELIIRREEARQISLLAR